MCEAALLNDYTLNARVVPRAGCNTLAPWTKLPILRAVQFTLQRPQDDPAAARRNDRSEEIYRVSTTDRCRPADLMPLSPRVEDELSVRPTVSLEPRTCYEYSRSSRSQVRPQRGCHGT
jgi:hypothetical protein